MNPFVKQSDSKEEDVSYSDVVASDVPEATLEHLFLCDFIDNLLHHITFEYERKQFETVEEFEKSDFFKTHNSHTKKGRKLTVSQIVGKIFPFDNKAKEMWYNTMGKKGVARAISNGKIKEGGIAYEQGYCTPEVLNKLLLAIGTYTHLFARMEGKSEFKSPIPIIERYRQSVKACFENHEPEIVFAEKFVECDEYQGTFDALWKVGDSYIIVDYKTYDAYKYLYGYNTSMYKNGKPNMKEENLKKLQLQMSLYARALEQMHPEIKVDCAYGIWFTPEGYHIFPLQLDLTLYYKALSEGVL